MTTRERDNPHTPPMWLTLCQQADWLARTTHQRHADIARRLGTDRPSIARAVIVWRWLVDTPDAMHEAMACRLTFTDALAQARAWRRQQIEAQRQQDDTADEGDSRVSLALWIAEQFAV